MYIDGFLDEDLERVLYEALRRNGTGKETCVLLSSKGGSAAVARKIVHLLREYFTVYDVAIPFRAASAATLICLGARQIGMGSMSGIGPIDAHLPGGNGTESSLLSAADFEAIQSNEMTFGVYAQVKRNSKKFMFGIASGVAANVFRQPYSTKVALHYRGPGLLRREHLKALTVMDRNDPAIPREALQYLGDGSDMIQMS